MTFIEFIGFIITMIALTILTVRRSREERRRREHPEDYEETQIQEEEQLKQFLHSLEIDEEKEASAPIKKESIVQRNLQEERMRPPQPQPNKMAEWKNPHRTVGKGFEFEGKLDDYETHNQIEDRHLESKVEERLKMKRKRQVVSADMRSAIPMEDAYLIKEEVEASSRLNNLINSLNSPKDLVILNEVLGPPQGLQPLWTPHDPSLPSKKKLDP